MRIILPTVVGLIAVGAMAGCSKHENVGTGTDAQPSCSALFADGVVPPSPAHGTDSLNCLTRNGVSYTVTASECADGRFLWQINGDSGAVAGWGFSGTQYWPTKDVTTDPAYAQATQLCTG